MTDKKKENVKKVNIERSGQRSADGGRGAPRAGKGGGSGANAKNAGGYASGANAKNARASGANAKNAGGANGRKPLVKPGKGAKGASSLSKKAKQSAASEVRIQKYIADCGVMSRRAAEKAIEEGRVTINGKSAEIGQKVIPFRDKVFLDKVKIEKKISDLPVYVMLNKPTGYVTTMSDDKGRKTVAELVEKVGRRIYPVGRLDMDSEGLLLMTDDGELTNALTHPKHNVPKYYDVRVAGSVTRAQLIQLSGEMEIDGYKIMPVDCALLSRGEDYSVIRMTLFEGRNRQIRKMCEVCGLTVKKLRRVAIGSLELNVKKGEWRYLTLAEVDYLRQSAGLGVLRK